MYYIFDMPIRFSKDKLIKLGDSLSEEFRGNTPFPHIVIDNFLKESDAKVLSNVYPKPSNSIWLGPYRSEHQYGKMGSGGSAKFDLLDEELYFSLLEFNSSNFLSFLEALTKIKGLIPDPYFGGGGLQQIIKGGILDIHTDFNDYKKLNIFRRLNVLLYLTSQWNEGDGGELELWDGPASKGKVLKKIPPIFNRLVVFETNKKTFHGHPSEWKSKKATRRSIALYFYTSNKVKGSLYNKKTDWQDITKKELPMWYRLKSKLKFKYRVKNFFKKIFL